MRECKRLIFHLIKMPKLLKTISQDSSFALLAATRDIFVSEGIKGLSVRKVAERAGCTTMAVYTRYGGKQGLIGALYDEGFEQLSLAQKKVSINLPAKKRVLALCCAYRATAQQFPHHYALMLGNLSGEHAPAPESAAKAMAAFDTLTNAVVNIDRRWRGQSRAAKEMAERLFAFCHGWVSLERLGFFENDLAASSAFKRSINAILDNK